MPIRLRSHVAALLLIAFAATAVAQRVPAQLRKIDAEASVKVSPLPPIDTNSFLPQVLRTHSKWDREEVENATSLPWNQGRTPTRNQLPVGRVGGSSLIADIRKWPGIGATGVAPADPTVAVGPNDVVATVNCAIAFYNRNGAIQFQQDFAAFFDGIGASGLRFDPRVAYDPVSKRYYAVALELLHTIGSYGTSKILLAVSDDDNPKGTWYRYRIEAKVIEDGKDYWFDYPGFGFNKDALVITGNLIGFTEATLSGAELIVLPKTPLLTGAPATATYFHDTEASTYQMAEVAETGVNVVYGVSVYDWTHVKICAIGTSTPTPTMTTWQVSVPSFDFPEGDVPTSAGEVETLDGRAMSTGYRSGRFLTAHTIRAPGQTQHRVRWYEFDVTAAPTLVQAGDVSPTAAGDHYFMPAINKNSLGEVSVLFSRTNGSMSPETMVASRVKADPAGEMRAPISLAKSEGPAEGRWGDYFKVTVDPVDGRTFWGVSMLSGGTTAQRGWRTEVSRWVLTPILSALTIPGNIASGATANGTVTLSGPATKETPIFLAASDDVLTVPPKIKVPAGSDSATFQFKAGPTTATKDVTITATLGTSTLTASTRVLTARADFTLSRTSVEGGSGDVTTLTVRLAKPAPAPGLKITFSSTSSLVNIPAELTVPAGKTAIAADFTCGETSTLVDAVVTASWLANNRSRPLAVTPPEVSDLLVSTGFTGGSDAVTGGTVTLTRAAPAGGVVVKLTSSHPALTLPATVTVAAGQTSATFSMTHTSIEKAALVTVSAVSGLKQVKRNVSVQPPVPFKLDRSAVSLIGGSNETVVMTAILNAPAAADIKVIFAVDDPAAQLSASSAIVPAGATTASVNVTAPTALDFDHTVIVQASANGRSVDQLVIVRRVIAKEIVIDPTSAVGGSSTKVMATITVTAPAPAGGLTIALSSSHPDVATVPATVFVPAGQTTVTVEVTHKKVTVNTRVTITATLGLAKTARVLVQK